MITYGSTTLTSYNSIVNTEVYYYKSTSPTALSGGSWSTTKPTWESGKYVWQKIRTIYEDETYTESDPVNITGQQGATGDAAYSYKLNASDTAVTVSKTGEYSVNKITFAATYKQGTGAVTAYAGRFKIETTLNGTTWTTAYTSSGNESSKEYTLPENIISVRCSLYQAGGTSVLLDITTIPIVKDGIDAIGLRDSIPYYLASDKQTGVTRLDQGWTRFKPELTTEKRYLWVYYVSRYSEGDTQPELIEIKNDVVNFENHGDKSPVEDCIVDINPVQDLHGYNSPWIGGAGKNLLPKYKYAETTTINGITFTVNNDGTVIANGTATNTAQLSCEFLGLIPAGNYYFTGCPSGGSSTKYDVYPWDNATSARLKKWDGTTNAASDFGAYTLQQIQIPEGHSGKIVLRVTSGTTVNNIVFKPMVIRSTETDSSYRPYENICPINGWTGCNVQRTGKNLFDDSIFANADAYIKYLALNVGKGTYTLSTTTPPVDAAASLFFFAGIVSSGANSSINGVSDGRSKTVTSVDGYITVAYRKTGTANPKDYDTQLELGSTVTDYEPYTGDTYSITFPQEAGTVYGGTLDVITGKLVVNKVGYTFNGTENGWNKSATYQGSFYYKWSNIPSGAGSAQKAFVCSHTNYVASTSNYAYGKSLSDNSCNLWVMQNPDATVNDFKSYLAEQYANGTPVTICYELAEPIIYQLTPQEIAMLTGQNYIFSNTGQTAISYYDNQTSTDPYIDYSATSAFEIAQSVSDNMGVFEPPYKEVEWVESTGKQYVYLDWKPPIKTWGFEVDFINRNAVGTTKGDWNESTNANGYGTIFGVRNASSVNNAQLSSYSNGLLRLGNGNNVAAGFKTDHSRQTIKLHGTTLTKTDGTTTTVTRTDENASKPYCNMTIFGLYEGLRRTSTGNIIQPSSTRIYSLKFYDGDTLTVDLVGAIRKADNITGLYDKVSKHFYPAPGMLFGNDVGDIPITNTITDTLNKNDVKVTVVNKNCSRMWETAVPFNRLEDGQKITVTYSYGNVVNSTQTSELIGWDDTSSNSYIYLRLIYPDGVKSEWIPCYYSQTARLTTHYGAGTPIILTYHENILSNATETAAGSSIVKGFFANASYYQNTSYTQYSAVKAGVNGIKGYTLAMRDSENTWSCFYSGAYKGTSTGKVVYTGGFILGKVIYSSGAGAQTSNSSLNTYYNYKEDVITSTNYDAYPVDLRYSTNCATTLIAQRPVYLVGTVESDGLFHLDASQWWTQTEPTFKDNKVYVYLGVAYSTYQIWLSTDNPAYMYYDGRFILYDRALTLQDIDSLKETLEGQIDGKVETWCQKSNPATNWSAEERPNHTGDLWYYIGESDNTYKNNTTYQYNGNTNTWSAYSANPDLFDKIDGKIDIYYGKPTITGAKEGDYLVDETDGSTYRYDTTQNKWVKITDYKTAIDKIEIGGRNLLRRDPKNYSATSYGAYDLALTEPLEADQKYIIQLWDVDVSHTGKTAEQLKVAVYYCGGALTFGKWQGTEYFTDGHADYLTFSFTPTSGNINHTDVTSAVIKFIRLYNSPASASGTMNMHVGKWKIEKGDKATDWSIAPEDMVRGTGFYSITTAPTSYTTTTGGFIPAYRIALSTVKTESGLEEVMVGDVIQQGYNTYPVGYVSTSYVYLGAVNSIRGATGAAGLNTARVVLYRRFASAPTGTNVAPIEEIEYTFSTGEIEGNLNSWTQAIPSGTDPVYMITASASGTGTTDKIPKTEWSEPVKILENGKNGNPGGNGSDGYNQATIYLYQRKSGTAPSKPSSAVEYTFSTGALKTTPTGWSRTIPANDGNPCYVTTAVAFAKTTTYSIPASGWSDVVILSQDGADGVSVTNVTSTNNTADGGTSVVTITLSDGTTKTFNVKNGTKGNTGATAQWYYGTSLTHTSGTATLVATSTSGAVVGSMYLNTQTSLVYKCTAVGTNNTWTYAGDLTTGVIDNIEIGGRNLLLNTAISEDNLSKVRASSTTFTFVTEDNIECYKTTGSNTAHMFNNTNTDSWSCLSEKLKANTTYTYSAWIKTNKTKTFGFTQYGHFNVTNNASTKSDKTHEDIPEKRIYRPEIIEANQWTKISITFTTNDLDGSAFGTYPVYSTGDDTVLYIYGMKLEKGTKATDWTPAPEDVDANIQQVQTNLDNLEIGGRNYFAQCTAVDGYIFEPGDTIHASTSNKQLTTPFIPTKAGEKWSLASWTETGNLPFITLAFYGNTEMSSLIGTRIKKNAESGSTYFCYEGCEAPEGANYIRASYTTFNNTARVKLEKGSKSTDWTPAPEDTQADIDTALAQSVEYIIGTQTAATGTWTGKASTLSELKDGTQIRYWLPYAGSGNATLNLTLKDGTATGAIPVYRQGGSASSTGVVTANRVTTHFPAGTSISMVYGINRVVSAVYSGTTYTDTFTGWFADGAYDSGNTYNRTRMQNAITAVTAITSGRIICGTILGYKNIGAGIQFDLSYPLLYAASAITAGKTGDNNFLQINSISVTGNGTVQSGAAKKELYLKGTVTGNTFTIASSPFMTTVIPTSTDGFYYIPLGMMYSTTAIYFTSSNRLYAYLDGAFQPVDIAAVLKANSAYDTAVQAQSEIVQTRQTLSLQIRDISVGGANLFEKTKAFEDTANEMTAHDSLTEFTYKDLAIRNANSITFNDQVVELSAYKYTDLTSDMWYTFSFYAKGGLDIGFMYAGTGNATIDNIIVSWSDETYTGFNATSTTSNIIWLTPTSNWQRYNIVFHVAEQEITASQRLIGLYARPTSNYTELTTEASETLTLESSTDSHFIMEGNEISICGYKLELGNKPTDWTPSEKDKTSYNNIISQINLSQEGVSIKADKINLEGTITANNGFIIDEYGNMTANNGTFNGLFESYATEINENTFDMKISNGHIHFYNNDRTLTEDERHVGYIGGVRNTTSYVNDSQKNNDGIMIRLYNTNDFVISSYKNNINKKVLEVVNHENDSISVDFWDDLHIYSGRNINLYAYQDSQYPELQFYRHSKNTNKYTLRGSLSLHSVTDNNSDISDRLYLWAKNQGSDLAGDQFLYFAGKGLKYSSNGQSIRNGYVVTDKYIVTQYFNLSDQTIAKNTSKNFTIDVTRDGYTPIMFVPRATSGMNAAYLSIYNWALSGNTANIYTHNISTTEDITNITIWVQVLYKLTY